MKKDKYRKYSYKCDMHVHTSPASPCGKVDVETTVKYYADLGFSSIVLTNHFNLDHAFKDFSSKDEAVSFYLDDFHRACDFGKGYGISVILGLEARFPENRNDYLVYGIDEDDVYRAYDFLDESYESFYKGFKNERNVIVQAHPFRDKMIVQSPDILDGIEVFNLHPNHNGRIGLAAKFAKENPHFIITGGTDFHHESHQGMCALCSKKKLNDSFELAALIKSHDYIFDVWGQKILPYN